MIRLLLLLVGVGAGFVQRVSGFGLGIFAMLFMPHFLPAHISAPAVSTLFSFGTSSWNALRHRKNISYRTVLPLLAASLVTIPIAVYFSSAVPAKVFQAILGTVLIALSLYFLFFEKKVRIRPTVRNGLLAGTVSGTLSGLFSTGGPPVVLYLTEALPDKHVYFEKMNSWRTHDGIDISAEENTIVKAAAKGVVEKVYEDNKLGIVVEIGHDGGIKTRYANLADINYIEVGRKVAQGDTVGSVGTSSLVEGKEPSHIHFEILKKDESQNPAEFIMK